MTYTVHETFSEAKNGVRLLDKRIIAVMPMANASKIKGPLQLLIENDVIHQRA